MFKDLILYTLKVVPLPRGMPGRSKAYLDEMIMNFLQGVIKRSYEGEKVFLIKSFIIYYNENNCVVYLIKIYHMFYPKDCLPLE